MKVAEHAKRIMQQNGVKLLYYGDPQTCHDIAKAAAIKAKHPINVMATVLSCVAKSPLFERTGHIKHLGYRYPVYELKEKTNAGGATHEQE
jgi:hypothetical protein